MSDPADEALADWSQLQAVMARLTAADTMDATLLALLLPAPRRDDAAAALWTAGADGWATLVGALPAADRTGTRLPLADIPLAQAALATPGVPMLRPASTDAPQTALVLALPLRGRIVGLLTIRWPGAVALGPREQRLYATLAHQAALLLENLVMVERLRAALGETQDQQRLLETVLDNIPVGVLCIEAPSRRPLLTNRMARMQLAGNPEPVSNPLPLAHMLYPGTDTPVAETDLAGMRAARTGQVQRVELDLIPPGSPRISVETIGAPVRDPHGKIDRVVVVMTDITGRKREAEERARLQEEVIRAQAAALAERSTPLIPISADVLVMPLIGTIDRERGQGILEAALHGARERRARVTILDITGVPSLDAAAVAAICQTAHALRLLGVTPVLSGVRPQVAQTLVDLGASLAGISTCGTLQAGIESALRPR